VPQACVAGLTLIESLVVVTVLALSIRLSFSSVEAIFISVGLTSASDDFLAHVHFARSEALKRNRRVVICKTGGGPRCASDGGWEKGWIVFDDVNNNAIADEGEEVILRHEGLPLNLRLNGNQPVAKYISFTSKGVTKLAGGGFQAGTLTLCRYSGGTTQAREVILNAIGRPRVQKTEVSHCG
jgi:type IV fimbrial biogenesis protein FimT